MRNERICNYFSCCLCIGWRIGPFFPISSFVRNKNNIFFLCNIKTKNYSIMLKLNNKYEKHKK